MALVEDARMDHVVGAGEPLMKRRKVYPEPQHPFHAEAHHQYSSARLTRPSDISLHPANSRLAGSSVQQQPYVRPPYPAVDYRRHGSASSASSALAPPEYGGRFHQATTYLRHASRSSLAASSASSSGRTAVGGVHGPEISGRGPQRQMGSGRAASMAALPGLSSMMRSTGSPPFPPRHQQQQQQQQQQLHGLAVQQQRHDHDHRQRMGSWSSSSTGGGESPAPLRGGGALSSTRPPPPHWGSAKNEYLPPPAYFRRENHPMSDEPSTPDRSLHHHQYQDQYQYPRHHHHHTSGGDGGRGKRSPLGSTTSSSDDDHHSASVSSLVPADHSSTTSASGMPAGKNSRYLREMDRRAILDRLAKGEKQATLAKEYQVSRAAICNLNKHRDEVMSRTDENPFAKHPKKRKLRVLKEETEEVGVVEDMGGQPSAAMMMAGAPPVGHRHGDHDDSDDEPLSSSVRRSVAALAMAAASGSGTVTVAPPGNGTVLDPAVPPVSTTTVHVIQSRAIQLLLTTLRSASTPLAEFKRATDRMLRLVMEEALASVPTKSVDIVLNDQQVKMQGITRQHTPCAISMEQEFCPMMEMFMLLEPTHPTGYVRLSPGGGGGDDAIMLVDANLPRASLRFHNVFVFDLVATCGEKVCETIQQLKDRGAQEAMVYLVALFVSSEVVAMVQCKFPRVQLITTQIDSSLNKKTQKRGAHLEGILERFTQVFNTDKTATTGNKRNGNSKSNSNGI